MVAYNFQARFAQAVASGEKCQTIRAPRKGGRHARVGEPVQLYTGMRTKACRKLVAPDPVVVEASWLAVCEGRVLRDSGVVSDPGALDALARADGFGDWAALRDWFREAHGLPFSGVLIRWQAADTEPASPACVEGAQGQAKQEAAQGRSGDE
jgi:hypothetical protein